MPLKLQSKQIIVDIVGKSFLSFANNLHPRLTNKPSTKNYSLTTAGSEGYLNGINYGLQHHRHQKKKKLKSKLTSVVGKTFYRDLTKVFNFLIDYSCR